MVEQPGQTRAVVGTGTWTLLLGVYEGRRVDIQMEITSDGRLHSYFYCLVCGDHDHDSWATPCN